VTQGDRLALRQLIENRISEIKNSLGTNFRRNKVAAQLKTRGVRRSQKPAAGKPDLKANVNHEVVKHGFSSIFSTDQVIPPISSIWCELQGPVLHSATGSGEK